MKLTIKNRTLVIHQNGFILSTMVFIAFGLKVFYQTANTPDLQWVLAPTKVLVQGFTGLHFSYDATRGYVNIAHQFVIAKSCAGVNFLIIAFCTSVFGFTLKFAQMKVQLFSVVAFLGLAYLLTVVVNAFRIISALVFRNASVQVPGLNANQLHATEGVIIYLSFLLIYYLILNYCFNRKRTASALQ